MADQNLQGVTTRALTTEQDSERASAISRRSNLASQYTNQFRADRDSFRRGGSVDNTSGPEVAALQADVTQEQDTSVPPSFQDVLQGGTEFDGDSQGANQVINPGMGGGGSSGGAAGKWVEGLSNLTILVAGTVAGGTS